MEKAPASEIARASFSIGCQLPFLAPLRAERAERVDRLRRQPDMAHHGNAALGQERHSLGHAGAAFELHRAALGLLQDPHRGMKRLLL